MTVVGYALGELLAMIPRKGALLTFLNPFPFNSKEHAFIVIMASAAATNSVSTEILAAQRLYYNENPNPAAAVFLVFSSQLLGFGIAGLLRSVLVQPTRWFPCLQTLLMDANLIQNAVAHQHSSRYSHRDSSPRQVRDQVPPQSLLGCVLYPSCLGNNPRMDLPSTSGTFDLLSC